MDYGQNRKQTVVNRDVTTVAQEGPSSPVESVALCGTRKLDNSLPERIVVPLSRTYDFFSLEGNPTEPVRFSSLMKPNPSVPSATLPA
jgi:hypothetical protein